MQGFSVLLIARHDRTRDALRQLLLKEPAFFAVAVTRWPEEAVNLVAQTCPDVIVLDTFQIGDWLELCQELHSRSPGARLVALHRNVPHSDALSEAVAVTHLSKDIRPSVLGAELVKLAMA